LQTFKFLTIQPRAILRLSFPDWLIWTWKSPSFRLT